MKPFIRKSTAAGLYSRFFLALACCLVCTFSFAVSAELQQQVVRSYPDASPVVWTEDENGLVATFTTAGGRIRHRLFYDPHENFKGAIRYYTGQDLPHLILQKFERQHRGAELKSVIEVCSEQGLCYFLQFKKGRHICRARYATDGSSEIVEKFRDGTVYPN